MKLGYPSKFKLVYISFVDSKYSGVYKKIVQQSKALMELGLAVSTIIVSTSDVDTSKLPKNFVIFDKWHSSSSLIRRFEKIVKVKDTVSQLSNVSPIAIYFRYTSPDPLMLFLLKDLAKYPIVAEFQTIELLELKGQSHFAFMCEKMFGARARRMMKGFIGVTEEICSAEISRCRDFTRPCVVIGNGIQVSSVPVRTPPEYDGKNLDLLCVAQVAKWHGLDRLIRGMADYNGNVNVRLHIVGDGSELVNLKKLVTDLKLGDSVFFHGFKTGKELDAFFDKCHIAVGSVGAHRKGVTETSELKAREYCARGIPFFCSVPDADFPEDFPYALRVPSVEETIDMNKILTFVKSVCCDQRHPHIMREYALENLDWSIKMKRLVGFLERIISSSR